MSRAIKIASTLLAILLFVSSGSIGASDGNSGNLLHNTELASPDGGVPAGWQTEVLPPCGFSFATHPSEKPGEPAGEFELINDEPVESSLRQTVTLEPGWYQLTADIKIESLGSAGSTPELFAKSMTLPVQTRTHAMGFKVGWHKYQLIFKTGPAVREVAVGVALGTWGSPNTGRILLRNPVLVPAQEPHTAQEISELKKYDLQRLADERFGPPEAKEAFSPPKYPPGRRWTVGAVYLGFLMISAFGWWAVSTRRQA